jgi:uncharacterized integral membrane protein
METHIAIKIVLAIGGLWVLLVALSANGLTAASLLWWVIALPIGAFVLFVLFGGLLAAMLAMIGWITPRR